MPNFEAYKEWLEELRRAGLLEEKLMIQEAYLEDLAETAMCIDGTRNGDAQTFYVTRQSTTECHVTVIPGDNAFIGDIIGVLDEYWLVTDRQIDEYEIITATITLCNHYLKFQNFKHEIYTCPMIIHSSSSKDATNRDVNVIDGSLTCYIPINDQTRQFYPDKRFALDRVYNRLGELELSVFKMSWWDTRSLNNGEGAHLASFRLEPDQFNKEKDNVDEMLCDYIEPDEPKEETHDPDPDETEPVPDEDTDDADTEPDDDEASDEPATETVEGYLKISGSTTVRTGGSRTYTVEVLDEDGSPVDTECGLDWSDSELPTGVTIKQSGMKLTLKASTNADEGAIIILICNDAAGVYMSDSLEVEVV